MKLAPVSSNLTINIINIDPTGPTCPSILNQVLGALPLSRIPGLQQQRGERLAAMVMEKKKKKGGTNGR